MGDPARAIGTDAAGNAYVADGRRIRRINFAGVIEEFAELRSRGAEALTLDGYGNLYTAIDNRIRRISTDCTDAVIAGTGNREYGGDGGPARSTGLSVSGMDVDRFGNVWFADHRSRRIRVSRRQRD